MMASTIAASKKRSGNRHPRHAPRDILDGAVRGAAGGVKYGIPDHDRALRRLASRQQRKHEADAGGDAGRLQRIAADAGGHLVVLLLGERLRLLDGLVELVLRRVGQIVDLPGGGGVVVRLGLLYCEVMAFPPGMFVSVKE